MEYRRHSNGLQTFLEHSGLLLMTVVAFTLQLFFSLAELQGAWWLAACAGGIALQITGASLITSAKLPLYRSGRFFSFGVKSIPAPLAGHYRWGWRVFLIGVVLSLGLLMGKL